VSYFLLGLSQFFILESWKIDLSLWGFGKKKVKKTISKNHYSLWRFKQKIVEAKNPIVFLLLYVPTPGSLRTLLALRLTYALY